MKTLNLYNNSISIYSNKQYLAAQCVISLFIARAIYNYVYTVSFARNYNPNIYLIICGYCLLPIKLTFIEHCRQFDTI